MSYTPNALEVLGVQGREGPKYMVLNFAVVPPVMALHFMFLFM